MKQKKCKPLLAALLTLVVLLVAVVLIWLAEVRPNAGKGRSEIITDFLRAELVYDGETATQEFTYDKDILTIGLEFYLPGEQPSGTLDVVLRDADTGEELSRSEGVMDYIVPDQYTTLGMDPAVTGQVGRRYRLEVTPHYATDAILAIGHSDGVALWREQMTVGDRVIDGTMAMQITYQRIGGYLTRFFLIVGGLAAVLAAFAVWAVLSGKIALHRLVFTLVLGFGLLYCFILPPYAAPDEKYHINQSFTMACHWANSLSRDEWRMGKTPITISFRRVGDENADLQNENTTVFTWETFTSQLFTTTDEPFDSHQKHNELQTDQNPLLYLASTAGVFLAYLLHLGFAPALLLGRLANLLLFAALAALLLCGVLLAPGKLVYLPLAALLLVVPGARLGHHAKAKKCAYLAACLLLALSLNTSLVTDILHKGQIAEGVTSEKTETDDENTLKNYVKRLYYYVENNPNPSSAEVAFWVQALQEGDVSPATLGQSFIFSPEKAGSYTDAQAFFTMASYALFGTDVTAGNADAYLPYFTPGSADQAYKMLYNLPACEEQFAALGLEVGSMDDRGTLDRAVLAQEVEAARAVRSSQSTVAEADKLTYTPGYILRHPVNTALLFVRSSVENGDHYIRSLVGGSLSYYTVDLAWGWVAVLYLLLAYAALPVQGAALEPSGKARVFCCAAAVFCCLLTVAGCLLWTPIRYETLYGLQGRYFLPILPLLLLTCLPRRLAAVQDEDAAQARLLATLGIVQAGVVVNIMLAIIAK